MGKYGELWENMENRDLYGNYGKLWGFLWENMENSICKMEFRMGKIGNFICKCGVERMGTTHYLQDIARPILMFCIYGICLSLICREYPPRAIEFGDLWSVDIRHELQKEIVGRVYPAHPNTKPCFVAMLLNARGHRINHWLNVIPAMVDPLPIPIAWQQVWTRSATQLYQYMNLILTMVNIRFMY